MREVDILTMTGLVWSLASRSGPWVSSSGIALATWVSSFIFVSDHRLVTFFISFIFDDLSATIRKNHVVGSSGFFILTAFFVTEVVSGIGIIDFVREFVVGWFLKNKRLYI